MVIDLLNHSVFAIYTVRIFGHERGNLKAAVIKVIFNAVFWFDSFFTEIFGNNLGKIRKQKVDVIACDIVV
ncbi:MAG: hypothetical protein ACD_79C00473G0010 [uncultured bacterium]|nr:MAG: hypothetical protein ACD_79C00473G0010 [uncultured bacterium]